MDSADGVLSESEEGVVTGLLSHLYDLSLAVKKWRKLASGMLRVEHIRFRGKIDDQVWERDLIVAPRRKWEFLKRERPDLACWSTARLGPLVLALSPPPIVVLADPDAGEGFDDGFGF